MIADVAVIEAHAFRAWPAEDEVDVDGWILRSSRGLPARRINSATTPIGGVADVAGAEATIRRWFRVRHTQPVVRVLSTSDPMIDRHLAATGMGEGEHDADAEPATRRNQAIGEGADR